jgi:hypothetical protein
MLPGVDQAMTEGSRPSPAMSRNHFLLLQQQHRQVKAPLDSLTCIAPERPPLPHSANEAFLGSIGPRIPSVLDSEGQERPAPREDCGIGLSGAHSQGAVHSLLPRPSWYRKPPQELLDVT